MSRYHYDDDGPCDVRDEPCEVDDEPCDGSDELGEVDSVSGSNRCKN